MLFKRPDACPLGQGCPLVVDDLASGMVKTHMSNSIITGSAAAATAFATGHKTSVRFLGVGPSEKDPKGKQLGFLPGVFPTAAPFAPVESILEVAKRNGKSTGLVATSRITHATPAAYACHIDDRGKDNEIIEHMVYADIDVIFGGGARHLIPKGESYTTSFGDKWGGKRTDGENLMKALTDRGYKFVDSKDGMNAVASGKVWGLFDDSHMDPDLDRDDLHPTQPSIAEMTKKAIEILSKNEEGFFLMVEGSQVDWAGHANDAAYMVYDFLAFDEAVGAALKFAKKDGDTLVMVFPDHNTGALSIGHEQSKFPPKYTGTSLQAMIDPIKDAKMTIQEIVNIIPDPATKDNVKETLVTYHGDYWKSMTDEVAKSVADIINGSKSRYDAYYPAAEYISKNVTPYGWTTHGHTAEDVPLWTYGPNRPVGTFDNTELAKIAAKAMGYSLNGSAAWEEHSEDILGATKKNPNPVATVGDWEYPVSKDIRKNKKTGKSERLFDVTVWAPASGKVYIPKQ
jgi:alkaline phosphatase